MTALDQLASKIRTARDAGLVAGDRAISEWDQLAQTAIMETAEQWLSERDFRTRTHASDTWCRQKFEQYEVEGLARRNEKGKREWHLHARLPFAAPGDRVAITKRITESYQNP